MVPARAMGGARTSANKSRSGVRVLGAAQLTTVKAASRHWITIWVMPQLESSSPAAPGAASPSQPYHVAATLANIKKPVFKHRSITTALGHDQFEVLGRPLDLHPISTTEHRNCVQTIAQKDEIKLRTSCLDISNRCFGSLMFKDS